MKTLWGFLLLGEIALFMVWATGCQNRPSPGTNDEFVRSPTSRARHRAVQRGEPGVFDYYVLALSWSPEFCHSHPDKPECSSGHFAFIVHGLWPQYAEGYPEHCSNAPGIADPSRMGDIMPDASLVAHEWSTHGTCSGLDADAYFGEVRKAFASIKIPQRLSAPRQALQLTPHELKEEFVAANPRLDGEDITIGCGSNYLTGISVCLDRQLQPRRCEGLRDCRANVVKVAPVR